MDTNATTEELLEAVLFYVVCPEAIRTPANQQLVES
jgi:hypothetical protein